MTKNNKTMSKILLTMTLALAACATEMPPAQTNAVPQDVAWSCYTRAVCNVPGGLPWEPSVAENRHHLCATPTVNDVIQPGDRAAHDWANAWLAGCELNQGRELHYSGVDPSTIEPLTCGGTGSCYAICEPLYIACE